MKISKLFHWLYFSVMMLPIFIIPIFAIFSRNENYNSNIELQVEENKILDFNQNIDYDNDWDTRYSTYERLDNHSFSILTDQTTLGDFYLQYSFGGDYRFDIGDIFLIDFKLNLPTTFTGNCFYFFTGQGTGYSSLNGDNLPKNQYYHYQSLKTISVNGTLNYYRFMSDYNGGTVYVKEPMLFNLTKMFGSGNEPSIEQFNVWFNDNYYNYVISESYFLKNYGILTYNDSDVGSQYLYTMYNGVDKYFNYDKVFNFGSLYDWLQLTFFDGNATLGFFIFWHLLIYWLLTSLLWLLFDVLMYVPLLVHRWLDKASLS